ncbi:hypothetical protein [Nitrococcus mobilis]|uniref:hypothetical protein n=1 Tax=Nitrococcus mobilis TaxID=35797 RepID=UPI001E331DA0|nr:hypothetical protein [Nitrococcus mobilis]
MDAVKAEGTAAYAHHITLENLSIIHHDADQQDVGVSTKCPAWGWIIRNNRIDGAGTGMYFGNSDGSAPFVGGMIEGNLIQDTIGYNIEIKRQKERPTAGVIPIQPETTVISYNVFSKVGSQSQVGATRPNVFIGGQPTEGAGRFDRYLVYGNFFLSEPRRSIISGRRPYCPL